MSERSAGVWLVFFALVSLLAASMFERGWWLVGLPAFIAFALGLFMVAVGGNRG